ncbi:MAG: cupin domain-containing protein [Actinomycetota bacterium]|nr:cupin domain-containing protein [Actinomycetota bacterium]
MSYPEPVYSGSTGKVSATLRPADHEPDLTYPSGNTVHYLATGASTAGKFGLYRWEMGPKPGGAEPHFHKTISESFFLLSGTVRLFNGQKWIDGTAGNFLFVPEGGIHAFRNESGLPASMLILFAPGAPREDYFEGLVDIAQGKALSEHERAEFFLRHDNHWL